MKANQNTKEKNRKCKCHTAVRRIDGPICTQQVKTNTNEANKQQGSRGFAIES